MLRIWVIGIWNNGLWRVRSRRPRIGIVLVIMNVPFSLSSFLLHSNLSCISLMNMVGLDLANFNLNLKDIITFSLAAKTVNIIWNIFTDSSGINCILSNHLKLRFQQIQYKIIDFLNRLPCKFSFLAIRRFNLFVVPPIMTWRLCVFKQFTQHGASYNHNGSIMLENSFIVCTYKHSRCSEICDSPLIAAIGFYINLNVIRFENFHGLFAIRRRKRLVQL